MIGRDRDASVAYLVEEVCVRRETQSLIPGIVRRREVFRVVFLAEIFANSLRHHPLEKLRSLSRETVKERAGQHILPAREDICGAVRQTLTQPVCDLVFCRTRDHITR